MEDVDGVAGAGGFDDATGVSDVVRVHEGGRGALRRSTEAVDSENRRDVESESALSTARGLPAGSSRRRGHVRE